MLLRPGLADDLAREDSLRRHLFMNNGSGEHPKQRPDIEHAPTPKSCSSGWPAIRWSLPQVFTCKSVKSSSTAREHRVLMVCLNADPIPSWALPAISWDLCEALLLIPVEMAQRDLEPQTLNICADRVIQRCPRIFAVRPGKDAGRLPSVGQGTVGMLSRAWMELLYVKGTEFRH